MGDDISFNNMDSWRGSSNKFGLTFKQIILQHIQRCVVNGSVEWHGGYWQDKTMPNWTEHFYVQNSREVYNNSVRMLRALLLGHFDKQMKKVDEELQKEYEGEYGKYQEATNKEKDAKYEWYNFKVEWHIKLFEELIMLSKRLNFFEEEVSEEEV